MLLSDWIGLVGVGCLISAYAGLTFKYLSPDNLAYPVINLIASILLSYSLLYTMNISSLVIEIFWGCISLYGIWTCLRKK